MRIRVLYTDTSTNARTEQTSLSLITNTSLGTYGGRDARADCTATLGLSAPNGAPATTVPGAQVAAVNPPELISGVPVGHVSAGSTTTTTTMSPGNGVLTVLTVSGEAVQGETLTAGYSRGNADGLGTISYQWLRDGLVIDGAIGSTYTLTQSDVGAGITVAATYIHGHGTSETVVSSAIGPVATGLVLNGTAGDDVLVGTAGDDLLDGGAGADTMIGLGGNDTYVVDNVRDIVTEEEAAGLDGVQSSVSYTLDANVEDLTLTGSDAIDGTGNDLNNVLRGNGAANRLDGGAGDDGLFAGSGDDMLVGGLGNDRLFGGAGADDMAGGDGNDIYAIDNAGDVVTELAGEGTADMVSASVSYSLTEHVERLILTGPAAIDGTGNGLNNIIRGNGAANTLDGGAGHDSFYAMGGDDVLVGGLGNDRLSGGTGADTMAGGAGNDIYVVENAGDLVTEAAGEGGDVVWSSVTYTLTDNVERLTLTGSAAIDGTGNELNNLIRGNGAGNRLDGAGGNDRIIGMGAGDTLIGGDGNDVLSGGAGPDAFLFNAALDASSNVDRIGDFSVADDTIQLHQSVFSALSLGTLSAGAFASGTAAQDADDRIVYDSATGNIYYDADGNGAGSQVLFAQVTAGLALTKADFLIVG